MDTVTVKIEVLVTTTYEVELTVPTDFADPDTGIRLAAKAAVVNGHDGLTEVGTDITTGNLTIIKESS